MGNVDCDRAISGCCMLGGGTEQVVVGDVYGNLRIQRPHTPFPAVRTGHKRLRGVFSEYTCSLEVCSLSIHASSAQVAQAQH